jgi:phospholipid/cholesterol/gamma-HCH transport system substrate-binding protein
MALRREVKVGMFVLAGLAAIALVIFLIGEERNAFAKKESFFTVFRDVQGLRRGSPVRMGGVDVGSVSQVAYGENAKDARIYVHLAMVANEARRIRGDSVATIESKGLLGDKMIVLTVGSPGAAPVAPGAQIRSRDAEDISAMLSKLGAVSIQVERVVGNLERTTQSLADAKFHDDLKASVSSMSQLLGALERREGYAGKLIGDPAEAERLSRTLANVERVTADLQQTSRSVNQILGRVQSGPGLAHEVIYGQEGEKAVAQFGQAAEEIGTTLRGIREGRGLARGLLFGDGTSEKFAADLNEMSGDMKQIVADLRAGKGTLGALLVDPSIYEDLKLVLGNVQRNKALRALVRYSIKKDEEAPRVEDRGGGALARPATTNPAAGASVPGAALDSGARASDGP